MSNDRIAGFWPPTTQAEVDKRIAECLEGWPRSSSIDVEVIAWLSRELTAARVTANETGCELDGARYRIAAVQLGRLGGKARAARMSKTELSDAGRKAASAPRPRCMCGCVKAMHDEDGCQSLFCDAECPKFTPRPSRRKATVGT